MVPKLVLLILSLAHLAVMLLLRCVGSELFLLEAIFLVRLPRLLLLLLLVGNVVERNSLLSVLRLSIDRVLNNCTKWDFFLLALFFALFSVS